MTAGSAPLMISGPLTSGFAAPRINVARPPWQFPTMIGSEVSG